MSTASNEARIHIIVVTVVRPTCILLEQIKLLLLSLVNWSDKVLYNIPMLQRLPLHVHPATVQRLEIYITSYSILRS